MPQEIYNHEHKVTLREITADSLTEILRLELAPHQNKHVAPNAVSIAQAHFAENAWFRGIYDDGIPVGFILMDLNEEKADYYLWRIMIAESFQRKGIGTKALALAAAYVSELQNAKELTTSCLSDSDGPLPFFEKSGFVQTGASNDDETCLKLIFEEESSAVTLTAIE